MPSHIDIPKAQFGGCGRADGESPAPTGWAIASDPPQPPLVRLVGDTAHADFRNAMELIECYGQLTNNREKSAELIIVAQCRPDSVSGSQLNSLRSEAPLAGILALLGSWCEGETRTGRPWPGAHRLYWYDFPAWWRRQMSLRAAGRCPDWARPANSGYPGAAKLHSFGEPEKSASAHPRFGQGLIVLRTPRRSTAESLADELQRAGYSTVWQPPGRPLPFIRGAIAGLWDGGQLSDAEADGLSRFCAEMIRNGAPIVALLDFPRRDRVDRALTVGASAVLGKPWLNSDLLSMLGKIIADSPHVRAA